MKRNYQKEFVGKRFMKRKKTNSILVAAILVVTLTLTAIPTMAGEFNSVYGYLYINDVIASPGVEVKITFPSGDEPEPPMKEYTDENGYYIIDFPGHNWEEGLFYVNLGGNWYTTTPSYVEIEPDFIKYPIDLYVEITNNPPNAPTLVAPTPSGKTGVGINPTLKVKATDSEGDTMTVTFYDASDDSIIGTDSSVSNGSTASFKWSGRNYTTTYSWYAIANDGQDSPQSSTWTFTTKDESTEPDPGPGPGPGPGPTNLAPTADAGGPYTGYATGEEITFDGSGSSDSDGTIISYNWNFGDGNTDTGETVTHSYTTAGNYKVTLQVVDDIGASDIDEVSVEIVQFNNPPTTPDLSGPNTGKDDTSYSYTAVSTDADGDTIMYMFIWGDGTNTTTDFVANGTETTESHIWSSYGFYTIIVTAQDPEGAMSGASELTVAIDVWWVKDIGYLIDTDSDGTYDLFYSNETEAETDTEKQTDGTYLINSDEDEQWDWVYDPETDTLTEYSPEKEKDEETDLTLWYGLIILIILILLLLGILAGRKKKPEPQKPAPKKPGNKTTPKNKK
jgi:PKD repeat protein